MNSDEGPAATGTDSQRPRLHDMCFACDVPVELYEPTELACYRA